jgi:predicted aspartyl protease
MMMLAAIAMLAQSVMPVQGAEGDPFWSARATTNEVRVGLTVLEGRGMPIVQAKLNGVDCTMLFDTGATHTTFNLDFVRKSVPGAKLTPVMLVGDSNVEGAPSYFQVESLDIGGARFEDFGAMALDLSHLPAAIGSRVDGILGMNTIGRVPMSLSLAKGEVVFCPGEEARRGFDKLTGRFPGDPMSIMLKAVYGGKRFGVIVDSGASMTFLLAATGWKTTGEAADFPAVDINGRTGLKPQVGESGRLVVGMDLALDIAPLVVDSQDPSMNRIGSDTLRRYDMLVDGFAVAFRKAE